VNRAQGVACDQAVRGEAIVGAGLVAATGGALEVGELSRAFARELLAVFERGSCQCPAQELECQARVPELVLGDARQRTFHRWLAGHFAGGQRFERGHRLTQAAFAQHEFGDGQEARLFEAVLDVEPAGADLGATVGAGESEAGARVGGLVGERTVAAFDQLARRTERQELQGEARERRDRGVFHLAQARPVGSELGALARRQRARVRSPCRFEPVCASLQGRQARCVRD